MRSKIGGALLLALVAACGGGSSNDGGGGSSTTSGNTPANLITIRGMAFSPLRLQVTPGATVTVRNLDSEPHSVTSESAPGAFTPGAASGVQFDTGIFSSGDRTFTIPANAAVGATIPYYCRSHLQAMATPTGEIAIGAAPASPGGAPTAPTTPTPTGPTSPYGM